jgi:hypothetical protein
VPWGDAGKFTEDAEFTEGAETIRVAAGGFRILL